MDNLFSLQGKVAGVRTYITGRKSDALAATVTELSEFGECLGIASDLSTSDGVNQLCRDITAREPALHILVNNAGATWGAPLMEFPEAGFDKVFDLNVKGIFLTVQGLLPLLRAAATDDDPARVINIASIGGLINPGMANYSYTSSKAAVIRLTSHLAADLAAENINVNGIAPGIFPSKMSKHLLEDEETLKDALKSIPKGRVGTPEDAAGTATYLCARASAFMTGHTLVLDGGAVAAAG